MQVSKWGNSLAIRLPANVVEVLGLKEGDDIEIEVAGARRFAVRRAAGVDKGSGKPRTERVGRVTADQVREIAELKLKDLNAIDVPGAIKQIEGTARSMGIVVEG